MSQSPCQSLALTLEPDPSAAPSLGAAVFDRRFAAVEEAYSCAARSPDGGVESLQGVSMETDNSRLAFTLSRLRPVAASRWHETPCLPDSCMVARMHFDADRSEPTLDDVRHVLLHARTFLGLAADARIRIGPEMGGCVIEALLLRFHLRGEGRSY